MSGAVDEKERRKRVVAMFRWLQRAEAAKLDAAIAANLTEPGYGS